MTVPETTAQPAAYDARATVRPGRFVWHDLMSTDPDRSAAFYAALFGWRTEPRSMGPAGTYTYLHAGRRAFGGIVPFDPRHGVPSHWVSYVSVDDVDATCARAAAAGGRTCIPPTDIPNVGRFAMIEDPDGAILSPISLPNGSAAPEAPPAAGTAWWHELASSDPARSAAFYRAVFGWRAEETPLPDGSSYWLFRGDAGPVGGLYRRLDGAPLRPHWTIYVAVPDADATLARALSLGATPAFARMDVPATGRIAGFVDPTGAAIAVGQVTA